MTSAGFLAGTRRIDSELSREKFLWRELDGIRSDLDLPEDWQLDQVAGMRLVLRVPANMAFRGRGKVVLVFGEDLMVRRLEATLSADALTDLFLAEPGQMAQFDERTRTMVFDFQGKRSVDEVMDWTRQVLGPCWIREDLYYDFDLIEATAVQEPVAASHIS